MGLLVDGEWRDQWYDSESSGGSFERQASKFRDRVEASSDAEYPAEPGRYHLYVSLACPWAHRVLLVRKLKRLEDVLSASVVDPLMAERGWEFAPARGEEAAPGATEDHVLGRDFLYQVYLAADPQASGRVTVPVLWDKTRGTIVNNESAELIRMLNSAFDAWGDESVDFCPPELIGEIDAVNQRVYSSVNNGVYKAGFATQTEPYQRAFEALFETLDWLDERLAVRRYLLGSRLTEADWRLFTTLIRFDAVYFGHFKCNLRRIADYQHLSGYLRDLYQIPGVRETVDFAHIKQHYYRSHEQINPTGIVPLGPEIDLDQQPGRDHLEAVAWRC